MEEVFNKGRDRLWWRSLVVFFQRLDIMGMTLLYMFPAYACLSYGYRYYAPVLFFRLLKSNMFLVASYSLLGLWLFVTFSLALCFAFITYAVQRSVLKQPYELSVAFKKSLHSLSFFLKPLCVWIFFLWAFCLFIQKFFLYAHVDRGLPLFWAQCLQYSLTALFFLLVIKLTQNHAFALCSYFVGDVSWEQALQKSETVLRKKPVFLYHVAWLLVICLPFWTVSWLVGMPLEDLLVKPSSKLMALFLFHCLFVFFATHRTLLFAKYAEKEL